MGMSSAEVLDTEGGLHSHGTQLHSVCRSDPRLEQDTEYEVGPHRNLPRQQIEIYMSWADVQP
jgi:hypothetical protein